MFPTRIELSTSSGGLCANAGIDRTKPAVLKPYLNDIEWMQFCNKVNGAIAPIHNSRRCALTLFGLTFVSFFVVIVAGFFADNSPGPILFAIPAGMMAVTLLTFLFAAAKGKTVQSNIQRVCDEISDKKTDLNFHVRYEGHYRHGDIRSRGTQYIEVSTGGATTTDTSPAGMLAQLEALTKTNNPASAADRLAELDKMKDMLTEEEYNKKRTDILSAV